MTTATHALVQLQALEDALLRLQDGSINAAALNEQARAAQVLLGALPERYGQVLLQLLDRLESSALFTEESCSFSHQGLLDSLQQWLDKARATLAGKTA